MHALGPVTLHGRHVRLEPLRSHHAEGLLAAALTAAEIWTWLLPRIDTPAAAAAFIAETMRLEASGEEYAFAVVLQESGRIVGSTRYLEVVAPHRRAEVGWTWYARDVWATHVNPECKLLLLQHAFESWGALRMQLKCDHLNTRSAAAIKRLGAHYEGTLRQHRIRADGTRRDTVYFSILDAEWPTVKAGLVQRLGQA